MKKIIFALALSVMATPAFAAPEYLNSGKILPTTLPFSEAVKIDKTLYLAGQVGNVPGTLKLAEGGITPETKQVMENVKTILETHNYTLNDVVKCMVFLADMSEWGEFNKVYSTYFKPGHFPARSALGSTGLAFGARVEVDCIASK